MIRGGERIRQFVLTAKTVAAVLRLPVDNVACNADGTCLLLDKRSVVSSHSKERGYGLCRLHGTAETAVLPMIIEHERLVSMLLRPQGAGYIFRAIQHAAALVVEAQNRRHHTERPRRRDRHHRQENDGLPTLCKADTPPGKCKVQYEKRTQAADEATGRR